MEPHQLKVVNGVRSRLATDAFLSSFAAPVDRSHFINCGSALRNIRDLGFLAVVRSPSPVWDRDFFFFSCSQSVYARAPARGE